MSEERKNYSIILTKLIAIELRVILGYLIDFLGEIEFSKNMLFR